MPNEIDIAFILIFLSGATIFDFKKKRIPNVYILVGVIATLIRAAVAGNINGIEEWLIGLICPIIILFILFAARVLGAGDIKVIAVISSMVSREWAVLFTGMIFITAGTFSLTVMIFRGELMRRIYVLGNYIYQISTEKKIMHYPRDEAESGKIAMVPFMFIGAFLTELIILIWR